MIGLLVVDLDGTLVNVNSFTEFVIYVAQDAVKRGKLDFLLKIIRIVGLRKLRCISHAAAKMTIMGYCSSFYKGDEVYSFFCSKLINQLRPSVLNLIDEYHKRGDKVVLATAAPAEYAKLLAMQCGLDFCIASEYMNKISPMQTYECVGEEKLQRVKELCLHENMRVAAVVSDHSDDLPLMRFAPIAYLVSPSILTEKKLRDEGLTYVQMD